MATLGNTLKKTAMVEALRHTLGNITEATSQVGISRKTHYQWLQFDPEYRENVEEIKEVAIDFVESKLFQLIDGPERTVETGDGTKTVKDSPNVTAVIFFLKCRAKSRGYNHSVESQVAVELPLQITISSDI